MKTRRLDGSRGRGGGGGGTESWERATEGEEAVSSQPERWMERTMNDRKRQRGGKEGGWKGELDED